MNRMSKAEFLDAMRDAEIEKRISREDIPDIDKEDNMDIMTDSDAAYLDMLGRVDTKPEEVSEAPKKRGRKPKAAKQPEQKPEEKKPQQAAEKKKPGRKPKAEKPEQAAEKKPGRKPETEKLEQAAAQEAAKTMDEAIAKANRQEESLRFLIGIARGRTREIIRNSEAHLKTADRLADLAEIYDSHIRTVEEMLK